MALLSFPIHTRDRTSDRGFKWIWFIRLVQIIVTLIVLALTAAKTAAFSVASCGVPGKLAWNLACVRPPFPTSPRTAPIDSLQAVLALLALAYFLFSTGPGSIGKILPWWIFIQLGLDALMFAFWLAAAATSKYNCSDLCNACSQWDSVAFDGLSCICNSSYYYWWKKRDMSPAPKKGLLEVRRTRHTAPLGTAAAKQAFDAVMVYVICPTAGLHCQ